MAGVLSELLKPRGDGPGEYLERQLRGAELICNQFSDLNSFIVWDLLHEEQKAFMFRRTLSKISVPQKQLTWAQELTESEVTTREPS